MPKWLGFVQEFNKVEDMSEGGFILLRPTEEVQNPVKTPSRTEFIEIVWDASKIGEEIRAEYSPHFSFLGVVKDILIVIYHVVVLHLLFTSYLIVFAQRA